jgi:hypothetical protein
MEGLMLDQRTILRAEELELARHGQQASPSADWRWLGWFGLVLAVMGLGDFVLAWYPPAFEQPTWGFGTVAATFSGLPLILLGFAGLVTAGAVLAKRWLLVLMATVLVAFGIFLLAAYTLFLHDSPAVLRAASPVAHLGIEKAIAKTSLLAIASVLTCFLGASAAVQRL